MIDATNVKSSYQPLDTTDSVPSTHAATQNSPSGTGDDADFRLPWSNR